MRINRVETMRTNQVEKETAGSQKPVLSIGIIFKNEIRCLERCMKALQPLRDAVPCELVMADTGSDDGSREIAEQYADILFDFPWIDDFAAARNAVMDRCSGEWYFSIDCDEWLDEDISGLTAFLTSPKRRQFETAAVIVRNYTIKDLSDYGDLLGIRMKRMSTGARYTGCIHEALPYKGGESIYRVKTVLHHDGYIVEGGPGGRPKQERNMPLLEKQLAERPQDLRLLIECVESSRNADERNKYLHMALDGVDEKWPGWQNFGPSVLRYGVLLETEPEGEITKREGIFARMTELFPKSPFTTIDAACVMFQLYDGTEQYDRAIALGEGYLSALAEYRSDNLELQIASLYGTLTLASEGKERYVRFLLAKDYYEEERYDEAVGMLSTLDPGKLDAELTRNYVGLLMNLQSFGGEDLSGHMAEFWEKITAPETEETLCQERKKAVAGVAGNCFQESWRNKETEEDRAHAYTLFLPLERKCETGLAAAVLETEDPAVLMEKLLTVEDWNKFSIHVLAHALERGVPFPLPGKPLTAEEMDSLADRLGKTGSVAALAMESQTDTPIRLFWVRGLFLSAMRAEANHLKQTKALLESTKDLLGTEEDCEQSEKTITLIRAFTEMERKFLPMYYAPEMLTEENLFMLLPIHRFGWHCIRAFAALDGGDVLGYVRSLKAGLTLCESMQPVVEFLLDHTPELQPDKTNSELLELAEKVRSMLEMFAPDDPAVAALKESPVYQRVAHLIEGDGT